jgi:hypothetical protein
MRERRQIDLHWPNLNCIGTAMESKLYCRSLRDEDMLDSPKLVRKQNLQALNISWERITGTEDL